MKNLISKKIEELIIDQNELIDQLENNSVDYFIKGKFEIKSNSRNILNTLCSVQTKFLAEHSNILTAFSSLRFTFETLIQTELLLAEPKYTYILYYSIYNHQINKTEKLITRLLEEIEIMREFQNMDKENPIFDPDEYITRPSKEELEKKLKPTESELYDFADRKLLLFSSGYRNFGFSYVYRFLKDVTLKRLQERLLEIKNLKRKKEVEILKQDRITSQFDFKRQRTKVFKELKDTRSWQKKAKVVGLDGEYELVYDFTSALIHATSYSFSTGNEVTEHDKRLTHDMIFQYSNRIIKNIKRYLNE